VVMYNIYTLSGEGVVMYNIYTALFLHILLI
jgi:hypothetical protein